MSHESIAVIGLAARFPGAPDVGRFWANLVEGEDGIAEFDDSQLLAAGELPERLAAGHYVRRRPVIVDADKFDARCFGMTPREADLRDPQQRILIELVHTALEHSGYDPARYEGAIGVFAGTNVNRYRIDNLERSEGLVDTMGFIAVEIANAPDYAATFISHQLGLRGPSMTIQTACSSSFTAIHTACRSLVAGDCDMAVAGVVSLELPLNQGYMYEPGSILAPDGIPKPFSAQANGTNFGSGGGTVVLKPLATALADRDTIYAVIRATALNNDADRKPGFTAPSPEGQADCITAALRRAGVDPAEIGYVEAHGTGTKLGDPVEIRGLAEAYRRVAAAALSPGSIPIGSVKANVGHLGQAAGMPGFIKTVMALHREQLPPSIHVDQINPLLKLDETPFFVNTGLRDWHRDPDRPRLAATSSFGIGGTNGHMIVEEAPLVSADAPARDSELVVWSAADEGAIDGLRGSLAAHLEALDPAEFGDTAHTLRVGRRERSLRQAVVAGTAVEAAGRLRGEDTLIVADGVSRELVLCFPGQGAQHPGMARRLYETEPRFRRYCEESFEELTPILGRNLCEVWLSADGDALAETAVAQPLLYVLETALARCLLDWGLRPEVLMGHSVGEIAAAAVAGVFRFGDGLRAITERARLMQEAPAGAMLAVAAHVDDITDDLADEVAIAAINGEQQVVLSGPEKALADVAERLRARRVTVRPLNSSRAFHSSAMEHAASEFEKVLAGMALAEPAMPVVSCATGAMLTAEQATSPAFWAEQIVRPVRFADAAATVMQRASALFLEVGPGNTLTSLLRSHSATSASSSLALPTLPTAERLGTDQAVLDRALGRLWVQGMPVDLSRRDEDHDYRRTAAPTYPYQRRRHWIEPSVPVLQDSTSVPQPPVEAVAPAPVEPPQVAEPADPTWSIGTVEWRRTAVGRAPVVDEEVDRLPALLVLPGVDRTGGLVRSAFQRAGYRTITAGTARQPLDLTSDEQWAALLERADQPAVIAYAALAGSPSDVSLTDLDQQVERCLHGVVAAARAAAHAQRRHRTPLALVVLTSNAVDVTGAEPVNPVTAMVPALLRTIEQEYPALRCHLVDVAEGTPEEVLGRQVAALTEPFVALRGTAVWTPVLRSLPRTARAGRPRLRLRGTYLITGGTGGIGQVVARTLAETGLRPRLALLSRSGELAAGAVADLEDNGAEVLVLRGDVADPESMRVAVAEVERRFGSVNGVVHSAGTPGGGLLERRAPADIDRVLAPKVRGTLVIDEVFADRAPLDFLMLFSSQAALTGMYGSGDYAAANAFMEAFAQTRGGAERVTMAVGWPGWAEVGMLADARPRPEPDVPGPLEYRSTVDAERDWVAAEHRIAGRPVLPGTGSLNLIVTAARELGVLSEGTPIELRETVFMVPVLVDEPIEVSVVFTPTAGVHRFRLQSRRSGEQGWVHHVNGILLAAEEQPEHADLAELREGLAEQQVSAPNGVVTFGARWQCVRRVWFTDGEGVGELSLDDEFHTDVADFPLHPALLDKAGAVIGGIASDKEYLPFLYKQFVFFAPLPARVVTHCQGRETEHGMLIMDFEVYDTAGALLARARQYTLRQVVGEELTASLSSADTGPAATVTAAPLPAAVIDESVPLLSPADGAVAFMELLNGTYPPVVFVDPPGGTLDLDGPATSPDADPGTPVPVVAAAVSALPPVPAPPPPTSPPPAQTGASAVEVLTTLWREALGIDDISPSDDFFDLGGNSLVAVRVTSRIREHFGVELSAGVLFEASTIKLLADELLAQGVG